MVLTNGTCEVCVRTSLWGGIGLATHLLPRARICHWLTTLTPPSASYTGTKGTHIQTTSRSTYLLRNTHLKRFTYLLSSLMTSIKQSFGWEDMSTQPIGLKMSCHHRFDRGCISSRLALWFLHIVIWVCNHNMKQNIYPGLREWRVKIQDGRHA